MPNQSLLPGLEDHSTISIPFNSLNQRFAARAVFSGSTIRNG